MAVVSVAAAGVLLVLYWQKLERERKRKIVFITFNWHTHFANNSHWKLIAVLSPAEQQLKVLIYEEQEVKENNRDALRWLMVFR